MTAGRLFPVLNLSITAAFIGLLLIQPILIDTGHMDDTVLLANLGWRGVNGLEPVLDFPHFYGGVTSKFVTWAFQIFGASYFSIQYAFVMMFIAASSVIWILGYQRIPISYLTLLTALAGTLILSLVPIETGRYEEPITRHSFVYNHAAIVLMMALSLFALLKAKPGPLEDGRAVFAGVTIYVLILLKPTFGVFGACVVLACLVQARWRCSLLIALGVGLGVWFLDPGMERALGSLSYLLGSAAAESTGIDFFVSEAVDLYVDHAVALGLLGGVLVLLRVATVRMILPMLILFAGYYAAILTTGGSTDLKILPFLIVIALICAVLSTKYNLADTYLPNSPKKRKLVTALPFVMAYFLIVPAVMSATASSVMAFAHKDASLIKAGPARDYVVADENSFFNTTVSETALSDIIFGILNGTPSVRSERDEYAMFADGIALLQEKPDFAQYGIISNGRMFDFTMPLGAPPVASFPVWPTTNLDYFTEPSPLSEDVDVVMISVDIPRLGLTNDALIRKMGAEFRLCRRSRIWSLYLRREHPEALCEQAW